MANLEVELSNVTSRVALSSSKHNDSADVERSLFLNGDASYSTIYEHSSPIRFTNSEGEFDFPSRLGIGISASTQSNEYIGTFVYVEAFSDAELGINEPDQFEATITLSHKDFQYYWDFLTTKRKFKVWISVEADSDISGYEMAMNVSEKNSWRISGFGIIEHNLNLLNRFDTQNWLVKNLAGHGHEYDQPNFFDALLNRLVEASIENGLIRHDQETVCENAKSIADSLFFACADKELRGTLRDWEFDRSEPQAFEKITEGKKQWRAWAFLECDDILVAYHYGENHSVVRSFLFQIDQFRLEEAAVVYVQTPELHNAYFDKLLLNMALATSIILTGEQLKQLMARPRGITEEMVEMEEGSKGNLYEKTGGNLSDLNSAIWKRRFSARFLRFIFAFSPFLVFGGLFYFGVEETSLILAGSYGGVLALIYGVLFIRDAIKFLFGIKNKDDLALDASTENYLSMLRTYRLTEGRLTDTHQIHETLCQNVREGIDWPNWVVALSGLIRDRAA
jgi:hypothetical protein